jgi:hypothetical protein
MDTETLIRSLAEKVEPVRPLRSPWRRTASWAAMAAVYLVVLVAVMSPRSDLSVRMQEPAFLLEQTAALLTGLAAAVAAFMTVVPGARPTMALLPLAPLSLWLGTVTVGVVQEYSLAGGGLLAWRADWGCVVTVLVGAAVPGVAMVRMLRSGVPLTPRLSALLGGLAAAGFGNLGVCLFHPHSSSLIVLFWHCGTVLALAVLAGVAGTRLLRWPAPPNASGTVPV